MALTELTKADLAAMGRAINWMRAESPDRAEQIEHKLKHEGFEAAGEFAAIAAQDQTLHLKPWECAPCNIWGYNQSSAIELRNRLVAAGLSVFEPDPMQALAEAERKQGKLRGISSN
jgi:hypothetical protein